MQDEKETVRKSLASEVRGEGQEGQKFNETEYQYCCDSCLFHNVVCPTLPSSVVQSVYTQYNRMLTCNIMEQSYSTFDLRTRIGEEVVGPKNLTSC